MHDAAGLFVTGTDTGVGKTHVAAMIARSLRAAGCKVGVYKPAASGCRRAADGTLVSDDAVMLWQAAGEPGELERVCPQRFEAPLAPHLAARAEGRVVDADLLYAGLDYWRRSSDFVVMEGAGGLFSPLAEDLLNVRFAEHLGRPIVVVAANRLGTIHNTLATVIAARAESPGLPLLGVVLNAATPDGDASRTSNGSELRKLLSSRGVPLLAEAAFGDEAFREPIDWLQLGGNAPNEPRG